MTHKLLVTVLCMAAALAAGCAHSKPSAVPVVEREWYTGFVYEHDGGMAIGGEADPTGWILVGDHGFKRLYLRRDGSLRDEGLAAFKGKYVEVKGEIDLIEVGGVETDRRYFRVLEVDIIRYGQEH